MCVCVCVCVCLFGKYKTCKSKILRLCIYLHMNNKPNILGVFIYLGLFRFFCFYCCCFSNQLQVHVSI